MSRPCSCLPLLELFLSGWFPALDDLTSALFNPSGAFRLDDPGAPRGSLVLRSSSTDMATSSSPATIRALSSVDIGTPTRAMIGDSRFQT